MNVCYVLTNQYISWIHYHKYTDYELNLDAKICISSGTLFLKRNLYESLEKYYSIRNVYCSISLDFCIHFFSRIVSANLVFESEQLDWL